MADAAADPAVCRSRPGRPFNLLHHDRRKYLLDFEALVEAHGGAIVSSSAEGKGPYGSPIWEFVFGHALFQIQKTDPARSVLEGYFRDKDLVSLVQRVHDKVKHFGPMRMEILRSGGDVVGSGAPYFVYESPEQMATLVRLMQEAGAVVANSHTSNVRTVGKKEVTPRNIAFKREVDPFNLLNPGRFEADDASDEKLPLNCRPTAGASVRHE